MASTAPLFCSSREPTDEQFLVAALRGDHRAWAKLANNLDRYLVTAVRRRSPDLPDDVRREVIQEVWAEVATRLDVNFDPSTRSARHYIASFLGLGLDRVRAAYRAPGERSRRRDAVRMEARLPSSCRLLSLHELNEDEQPDDPRCEVERDKVEAAIDIRRARQLAGPAVARAIDMMWEGDFGCEAAAVSIGVNRITLRRQLRQLGLRLSAA